MDVLPSHAPTPCRLLSLILATALPALVGTRADAAWLTAPSGARVFVRGVGYSPYHPKEKMNLSPATKARDRALVQGVNANCLMAWERLSFDEAKAWQKAGIYTVPQVPYQPNRQSVFVNGQLAPIPVYVDPDNRKGLRDAARDLGSQLKGNPGVLAINVGSGYSWNAHSADLGFSYAGYDDLTLAAFRKRLQARFGTVEQFNALTSQSAQSFSDVLPSLGLTPSPVFWEWWLFMRDALGDYLGEARDGIRAIGSETPTTYSIPWGVRWDPGSQGARIPFLDIVGGNIFFTHTLTWQRYCAALCQLISSAHGRPVLVTETGAHTLSNQGDTAQRILKQSVACALLHPEIAGVLHEFCDEWQLTAKPDVQDDSSNREYWGLVSGHRQPKPTYEAAREIFGVIKRHETMFQEWQAPPLVYLSQQDLDWWRLGGTDGLFFERVAAELYRHGVAFRLLDTEGLLKMTVKDNPRLILCDTMLSANPDGTDDVQGRIVSHIEAGGEVLYISRMPWQRLYGQSPAPAELRPDQEGPLSRRYGKGRCTLIPSYSLTDQEVRFSIEDYLGDLLKVRPVAAIEPAEARANVFWRVFQDREGFWLWMVNVGTQPIPVLNIELGQGMDYRKVSLREADGAKLGFVRGKPLVGGLNVYALIFLGKSAAYQAPPPEQTVVEEGTETPTATPAVAAPATEPAPNLDGQPAPAPQPEAPPAAAPN